MIHHARRTANGALVNRFHAHEILWMLAIHGNFRLVIYDLHEVWFQLDFFV